MDQELDMTRELRLASSRRAWLVELTALADIRPPTTIDADNGYDREADRMERYLEVLAPKCSDPIVMRQAINRGLGTWRFFPSPAEIVSALDAMPKAPVRSERIQTIEHHAKREPLTPEQSALIEQRKNHLTHAAKVAHKLPPVPPHMVEAKQRDRAKLSAGASPEWQELMAQPTP